MIYQFCVADCYFEITVPDQWNMQALLPSFGPFVCRRVIRSDLLFTLKVTQAASAAVEHSLPLLEESDNDLGHIRLSDAGAEGYRIEVSYDTGLRKIHTVTVNRQFSEAVSGIHYEDETASIALTSIIRMLFAQTVLGSGGISIHASCICRNKAGYLFLGKSGTGKSTHARCWLKAFPDCNLLNDDNPVLCLKNGTVLVYGSPWSGKTPCYIQQSCPVKGIVRLRQNETNRFRKLHDVEAFIAMLPSCSVFRKDAQLQEKLYNLLIKISEQVTVGTLDCIPEQTAALMCYNELEK